MSRMAASMRCRSRLSSSSSACGSSLRALSSVGDMAGGVGMRTDGGREAIEAVRFGSCSGLSPFGSGGVGGGTAMDDDPNPNDRKSIEKPRFACSSAPAQRSAARHTFFAAFASSSFNRSAGEGPGGGAGIVPVLTATFSGFSSTGLVENTRAIAIILSGLAFFTVAADAGASSDGLLAGFFLGVGACVAMAGAGGGTRPIDEDEDGPAKSYIVGSVTPRPAWDR